MPESITIAFYLGLNSATATAVLSGRDHQNPVVVPWPKSLLSFVPLYALVYYFANEHSNNHLRRLQPTEDSCNWGYDRALTESDSPWGVPRSHHKFASFPAWNTVYTEILRKRGISLYAAEKFDNDAYLGLFTQLATEYISTWLSNKWEDAVSIPKRFILVTPPYADALYKSMSIQRLIEQHCAISYSEICIIPYVYGMLRGCSLPTFRVGDSIMACHMDIEITTVTRYEVVDISKPLPTLRAESARLLTTGVQDVIESFCRLLSKDGTLKTTCDESKTDRNEGKRVVSQDQIIRKSIPGLGKLHLSAPVFEQGVFSMVFKQISFAIFQEMTASTSIYTALSGPLAVVPALRSYLPQNLHILEAPQPDISYCEGASLLRSTHEYVANSPSFSITLSPGQPIHESFQNDQSDVTRMTLQFQLFDELDELGSETGGETLLAAGKYFQTPESYEEYVEICKEYFERICDDLKSHIRDIGEDYKHAECINLDLLHLAAAVSDDKLIRIGMIGRIPINRISTFRYPFGELKHCSLHTAIWFNSNPRAIVKLLLQSGATPEGFGHECPMHFATARDLPTVLHVFEEHCKEIFIRLAPDLLQLAIHAKARGAMKFLINHGILYQREYFPCPSKLSQIPSDKQIAFQPLVEMLMREWVEEATLTLKQYVQKSGFKDPFQTVFDHSTDGNTQMRQLLSQWLSGCFHVVDENGRNALYWIVRLGYEDLLWRHSSLIVSNVCLEDRFVHAFNTATRYKNYGCILPLIENGPGFTEAEKQSLKEQLIQNLPSSTRETLLHEATKRNVSRWSQISRNVIIKILLGIDHVNIDSKGSDGRTCLSRAAQNGDVAIVKMLLEIGKADVNSQGQYGWTPLLWAAQNGHELVVELLLKTGIADVDKRDQHGFTPLRWAAGKGHTAVVQLLLATGKVDVYSKDDLGSTPIEAAHKKGHEEVVQLLKEDFQRVYGNQQGLQSVTALLGSSS